MLLNREFNNELKALNDTLDKHLEIMEHKKEANKHLINIDPRMYVMQRDVTYR